MATKIINSLINKIKSTGSLHKKKLIVIAVFAIAFIIAKKRLKTNHIINTVMFFFKISSKVMDLFPAPIFTSYRSVLPFTYQPQQSMPELIKAMNISEILPKIKVFVNQFRKMFMELLKNSNFVSCLEWFPTLSCTMQQVYTSSLRINIIVISKLLERLRCLKKP